MELLVIQKKIFEIRGQRVMLDFDLAELYDVETRALNQAVKRNVDIFPDDFMFSLTRKEWKIMSSQIVMTYSVKRPKSSPPLAFTEYGVAMLANVLKSKKARQTSVAIVRAFIALKDFALHYKQLGLKLSVLEKKYNRQFKDVYEAINYLMQKDEQETKQKKRKKIGFKLPKK
jgi:hypothetical protein